MDFHGDIFGRIIWSLVIRHIFYALLKIIFLSVYFNGVLWEIQLNSRPSRRPCQFEKHPSLYSQGFHAVTVRANWRIIFRFADGNIFDVEMLGYC
jgi:hypothetical protein